MSLHERNDFLRLFPGKTTIFLRVSIEPGQQNPIFAVAPYEWHLQSRITTEL